MEQAAEGLTLRVADNKTGYFGVHPTLLKPGRSKPYGAGEERWQEREPGARSPEGKPPLTSNEVLQ